MTGIRPFHIVILISLFMWLAVPAFAEDPVVVIVDGIEGEVLNNVREALALPYGLIREGKVDRFWLERFSEQAAGMARSAVEPFGYYKARIDVEIEEEKGGSYRLLVRVVPGEPVRVAETTVVLTGSGAEEPELKKLAASFPLRKGRVLLQRRYEEAKAALQSRAQELGYLDASFPVHEIRIDRGRSEARIHLELETGGRYMFDGTRIEGAPDYPQKFLHRYLTFKPGEPFSYARIGETQLNFTNSERFREVNITPEKDKSEEFRVPMLVQLKQAPSGSLRQGIGYGTDTGARFNVRYRELNMLNRGHELYSNLYLSERLQAWRRATFCRIRRISGTPRPFS